MMVFCNECGMSVTEGSKFCLNCGSPLPTVPLDASPPPNASPPPPPNEQESKKKGAGGFFASAPGIALVVVIAALLIAGVVIGVVFILRSGSNSAVDAETVKVWDEYENITNADSADLATINMDPTALAKTQEDLKKTQAKVEALEKALKQTGGTKERLQSTSSNSQKPSNNKRDQKADQLAATIKAYDEYIKKMNELFKVLAGGQLTNPQVVATLNAILSELKTMAADVKTLANKFLKDNGKVTAKTFNPPILNKPAAIATEVEKINKTAAASGQQPTTGSAPNQTPAAGIAGKYVGGDATITLNNDGTCSAGNASAEVTVSGTYSVSGNTITFTSASGTIDTGTIEDGVILLGGVRLTKQ